MSQRQPPYRRPSWARHEISYECYMHPRRQNHEHPFGSDNGMENFSYDEVHLARWELPSGLSQRLPNKLSHAAEEWQYAGAAVNTALDRIKRLDDQAIYRGYPDKATSHLLRTTSKQSSMVPGAATPPLSGSTSPTSLLPKSSTSLDTFGSFEGLPQHRVLGMESPPYIPVDSFTSQTPELVAQITSAMMPDAHALAGRLSPLSLTIDRRDSVAGTPPTPLFDENAWETYMNTFKAELEDIRKHAWFRFRGQCHTINKLRVELGQDPNTTESLAEFNRWWDAMKLQITEYEERVSQLDLPDVEHMKIERQAKGMLV